MLEEFGFKSFDASALLSVIVVLLFDVESFVTNLSSFLKSRGEQKFTPLSDDQEITELYIYVSMPTSSAGSVPGVDLEFESSWLTDW